MNAQGRVCDGDAVTGWSAGVIARVTSKRQESPLNDLSMTRNYPEICGCATQGPVIIAQGFDSYASVSK